jgi:subtilase family serine protease
MRIQYRVRDLLLLTAVAAIGIAIVRWYVMAAPDLIITQVRFVPHSPKVGEWIGVIVRIKNVGRETAKDFYLQRGTEGKGYNVGTAELKLGEELDDQWGVLRYWQAGTNQLLFRIDPENSVNEVNEGNNTFSCQIVIHE